MIFTSTVLYVIPAELYTDSTFRLGIHVNGTRCFGVEHRISRRATEVSFRNPSRDSTDPSS